nr:lymphoid-restricted membrane protein [Microcebus murinus]
MASARKVPGKRHNPVESICRKIRAIQRREAISDPIRQIIKYQSSSFDSPQTNTKRNFEEVLRKLTAARIPVPDSHLSSYDTVDTFASAPQILSPGTPSSAHLSPPEAETYSVILTSSGNVSKSRSASNRTYTSLMSQTRKQEFSSSEGLNNYASDNHFSALTLDFDSNFCRSSECLDPQVSVVKKLSLNEDDQMASSGGLAQIYVSDDDDVDVERDQSFPSAQQTCRQVSSVTIQYRSIASANLAWMVQDNHLSSEACCFHWWVIFAVTSNVATMNIFDRHVLDVETHVVPWKSLTQSFMVHFNGLYFSCNIDWSKGDHHARFENTSLHSAHRDSANTTNFVDILERQTQGLVSWTSWWQDAIQSFKQCGSTGIAIFTGDFPSLEPKHVSTWLQHVVTIPARNWHKCYCVRVVANFLNGDISGDTMLTLSFQFIRDPRILEGALSHFSGLLLKFFDGSFVDPTTFVDQMASSGGLAQIYVSDDDDVDVGSVGVAKIMDYLRQTHSHDSEDSGLEELWNVLDPEKRDPHVDLETFQALMKEWMAYCRTKWEGATSRSSSSIDDSVFEQPDSIQLSGAIKMTTGRTNSTSGSFEALGGDTSRGVLEVSDLITYVADLHFNKQKLEEENNKFKLALETLEETNSQLSQDCAELRLQIKSAHQAIMRTNLLKEELEELKLSVNASEEQKAVTVAQNKQLETENRALILKIRILQEENMKNIMDIDKLEKTIEELSKTEIEHQMQLYTYENALLNKDASLQKVGAVPSHESLQNCAFTSRNGIRLNVSGERNSVISGEKSLHYELILAQSAEVGNAEVAVQFNHLSSLDVMMNQKCCCYQRTPEQRGVEFTATLQKMHEEVSEVATLIERFLQWVTDPEFTMKEKWERQLTEFKHTVEEKLNLCILMLDSLENHKESLDKEFAKLMETLKRSRLENFYFRKEFLSSQKQLEAIRQLQEDAVNQEAILRKRLQEAGQRLADAEEQVKDRDRAAHSAREKAASLLQKLEEAISEQRNLQTLNAELSDACQTLGQKTRKLKNALSLDSLTAIPRLEVTSFSCVANQIHASCEKPKYEEIKDGALAVTRQHKCPGLTGGPHPGTDLPGSIRMNDDLRMEAYNKQRDLVFKALSNLVATYLSTFSFPSLPVAVPECQANQVARIFGTYRTNLLVLFPPPRALFPFPFIKLLFDCQGAFQKPIKLFLW